MSINYLSKAIKIGTPIVAVGMLSSKAQKEEVKTENKYSSQPSPSFIPPFVSMPQYPERTQPKTADKDKSRLEETKSIYRKILLSQGIFNTKSYLDAIEDTVISRNNKKISFIAHKINSEETNLAKKYSLEENYLFFPASSLGNNNFNYSAQQVPDLLKTQKQRIEFLKKTNLINSNNYLDQTNNSIWNMTPSQGNPDFGWKMHIYSTTEDDYEKIAPTILPYLQKNKFLHKTLGWAITPEMINASEASDQKISQKGKSFVIYPRSEEEFRKIAKDLNKLITENNLTLPNNENGICGDRVLDKTGRIFYRYQFDRNMNYRANDGNYLPDNMREEDDPFLHINKIITPKVEEIPYLEHYLGINSHNDNIREESPQISSQEKNNYTCCTIQ